jgi:hypothetical protein
MSDPAQINRSLGTIRTELEYLAAAGVLSPPQLKSIQAQLPVRLRFLFIEYRLNCNSKEMVNLPHM